ncbi:MAG TPA: ankyrin repeat domain-containing protein [Solirubrobacteraceae bacterium]|nr:ankyrin repeat domain-containing protein [Solirubrobacteraceae bacterium]
MPIRSLPRRPSLEHLRNEARALQRLVRQGDAAALDRAREFHPRSAERADGFRLSDAQLTVARSYGQPSWPRLKAYVEAIRRYARDPHEVPPATDEADEFLRLACLVYGGDDLSRAGAAAGMLRRDPSLSRRSIHTAAAAGDAEAASAMLEGDRSRAGAPGGPFGWEPLLYAAYSRLAPDGRGRSQTAVARVLLEHGADPNAGYLWDGTYLFTALTGAFGYGEDAPNQPPHAESAALARLLLEAGADPNDDQTIYNRHFRPDDDHLELLLAHGLGRARRGPWPHRLGEHLTEPRLLLEDALVFVADNDAYAGRVDLLLRHGVDPDGRGTGHPALRGLRPVERARLHGAQRIEALLLAAGARPPEDDGVDALLALAVRGDRAGVERELAHDPGLAQALVRRHPKALIDAAERANAAGVELLARSGYDVNARHGQAALHVAAYAGDRALCELLLRLGADPTIRDTSFDATPAGWAAHAHHDDLAAWLEAQ